MSVRRVRPAPGSPQVSVRQSQTGSGQSAGQCSFRPRGFISAEQPRRSHIDVIERADEASSRRGEALRSHVRVVVIVLGPPPPSQTLLLGWDPLPGWTPHLIETPPTHPGWTPLPPLVPVCRCFFEAALHLPLPQIRLKMSWRGHLGPPPHAENT